MTFLSSALVALLAAWTGFRLSAAARVFAPLFESLGSSLPVLTHLLLSVPRVAHLIVGLLVAVAVLWKDWLTGSERQRLQLDLLALIGCCMWYQLFQEAMLVPMLRLMAKIGA